MAPTSFSAGLMKADNIPNTKRKAQEAMAPTAEEERPGSAAAADPDARLREIATLLRATSDEARRGPFGCVMSPAEANDYADLLATRRRLGKERGALEDAAERRRTESAVERDRETGAPMSEADEADDVDCPLCLDPVSKVPDLRVRLSCCGKLTCVECNAKRDENQKDEAGKMMHAFMSDFIAQNRNPLDLDDDAIMAKLMESGRADNLSRCILCRKKSPTDHAEYMDHLVENSEKGCAWAEYNLYQDLIKETESRGTAIEFLHKSSSQGYHIAEDRLGQLYMAGDEGVERSECEALRLWRTAAAKGSPQAQYSLAIHLSGEDDDGEMFRLLTLSAAQGFMLAQESLAECYLHARGTAKNESRSVYWLKKALEQGGNGHAKCMLGLILVDTATELYGRPDLPGYSPIPVALRWLRRALDDDEPHEPAQEALVDIESKYCTACAHCARTPAEGETFFRCSKCRAARYCGKSCQRAHWRTGHKVDCCDHSSAE